MSLSVRRIEGVHAASYMSFNQRSKVCMRLHELELAVGRYGVERCDKHCQYSLHSADSACREVCPVDSAREDL